MRGGTRMALGPQMAEGMEYVDIPVKLLMDRTLTNIDKRNAAIITARISENAARPASTKLADSLRRLVESGWFRHSGNGPITRDSIRPAWLKGAEQ